MFLVISIAKISMNTISHIRRPTVIASCNNFLVKIAKHWLNWVKPRTICWQRQDFKDNSTFGIPSLNPASQAFGFVCLGIIPDKINLAHMFIQFSQSLNKLQHYLAAFAFIYMVVYLAWICFKRAENNHFASGFPERGNFPRFSFLCPLLPRIWPYQIRPCFIQIKGYLASFVQRPESIVNEVFLTSYAGSGEVIQRLERLYEYPSSAMMRRIHSGLMFFTTLFFMAAWHNPLKFQLLQANPNTVGFVLSILIICFLCSVLISIGRPGENFSSRDFIPSWLNRLIHIRTLMKCKSTILAISSTFKCWMLESQITLARLYNRVFVDLSNFLTSAFSFIDNSLTKIGRMVTSFIGNHYNRLSHNIEALFSRQGNIELSKAIEQAVKLAEKQSNLDSAVKKLGNTGFIVHTIGLVTFCFLVYRNNPMAALTKIISIGGDTDSNAAILGAWLGALCGMGWISERLLSKLQGGPFGRRHLEALGRELAKEYGQSRAPRYSWIYALARNVAMIPVIVWIGIKLIFYKWHYAVLFD